MYFYCLRFWVPSHLLSSIGVADPWFPKVGGANSRGGSANLLFCKHLPKTAWRQECIPVGCVTAAHWPYAEVCSRGVWYPSMHWGRHPSPVNRITDTSKNITLATTSLRPVMKEFGPIGGRVHGAPLDPPVIGHESRRHEKCSMLEIIVSIHTRHYRFVPVSWSSINASGRSTWSNFGCATSSKIFFIAMQFLRKFVQIIGWRPSLGLASTLANLRSAPACCCFLKMYLIFKAC